VAAEVTRTIWSFRGLLPVYWCVGEIDIEHAISRNYYSDPCGGCAYSCDPMSCLPVRGQLGDYKNSKIVGQLFYSAVAKEYPAIHTLSTSPGGISRGLGEGGGGSFAERGFFPLTLFEHVPWIFRLMCVTWSLEDGAARYVEALTGEPKWPAGSMPMSGPNCLLIPGGCLWGAKGPMTDNREYASYLADDELAAKVAVKVRAYTAKWAAAVGTQSMERDMPPPSPISPVRMKYGKGSEWVAARAELL